ncbi:MAG: hypothetical protein EAX89_10940 [Candidatus Lokiarchaeota archaeon]|nr:hypothetical protein [Candidatus Lokiarchaeota archaeon]
MYQIEKLSDTCFFIKAIGTFPFFLKLESLNAILDLLKRDNDRLYRTAFIISNNPPLDTEFSFLLDKAKSSKRKIVSNLEEAKRWIGLSRIIIKKD